jgi:hypothetical protein
VVVVVAIVAVVVVVRQVQEEGMRVREETLWQEDWQLVEGEDLGSHQCGCCWHPSVGGKTHLLIQINIPH